MKDKIKFNVRIHDKIADKYEKIHDEIFNDIEQNRIRNALRQAIDAVKNSEDNLKACDIGCGSGNLTQHLLDSEVRTVSADVSENFLKLIKEKFSSTGLSKTLRINGHNLSNIEDCSFNLVAAYSVLHHVPDYMHLLKEMCRILKSGGIIYLDHEANEIYHKKPKEYAEFLKLAIPKRAVLWKYLRLLSDFSFYIRFIKKRINPRYKNEGDIHVWPDDCIEWDEIVQLLISQGFDIIVKKDYLIYKDSYRKNIYERYKCICSDMTMLIARKK